MFFCFSRSPTYYLWIQYLGAIDTFCPVLTTRAVAVTSVIPDFPLAEKKTKYERYIVFFGSPPHTYICPRVMKELLFFI